MKYILIAITLFIFIFVAGIAVAMQAYAIDAPDDLSIPKHKVFRNLAETGDFLIVFEYEFATDNYSDTPASESLIFRLYDIDGTSLLQSASPYVYPYYESNGYGTGVSAFYFGASDSPPAWESTLTIEIMGVPAFFSTTVSEKYTLTESDYLSETTQEANQDALYDFVLLEADRLTADYEATGVILKSSSDSNLVLSTYGESYFGNAISGLSQLCPDLFFIQVYIPEQMSTSYNMTLQTTLTNRLASDDIGKGFTRLGSKIGTSGAFAAAAVTFALTMLLCIWTTKKGWGLEIGMLGSAIVGTFMAILVGNVVFTILMILALLAGMGIVYLILFKRSA